MSAYIYMTNDKRIRIRMQRCIFRYEGVTRYIYIYINMTNDKFRRGDSQNPTSPSVSVACGFAARACHGFHKTHGCSSHRLRQLQALSVSYVFADCVDCRSNCCVSTDTFISFLCLILKTVARLLSAAPLRNVSATLRKQENTKYGASGLTS